jgi:hypothetical protein
MNKQKTKCAKTWWEKPVSEEGAGDGGKEGQVGS